jgi:hypothetical protein
MALRTAFTLLWFPFPITSRQDRDPHRGGFPFTFQASGRRVKVRVFPPHPEERG